LKSPNEQIVKVNFRISKQLLNGLKEVAAIRRVSLNSLFLSAIEFYLNDGREKGTSDQYILKLSQNQKNLKVDVEIIAEMLSFFVMHYFCYTPELPESQKKALLLSGKTRHEKFMELLAKRMQGKGSSYSHLLNHIEMQGEI
jgi:hypothetical protein